MILLKKQVLPNVCLKLKVQNYLTKENENSLNLLYNNFPQFFIILRTSEEEISFSYLSFKYLIKIQEIGALCWE
jgi:hypothetical protein